MVPIALIAGISTAWARVSHVPSCCHCLRFTDGHRADAKDINASFGAVIKGGDAGTHTVDVDVLAGPNITAASLFQYKGFLLGGTASLNTTLLHDAGSGAPVTLAGVGALAGVQKGDLTAAVAR